MSWQSAVNQASTAGVVASASAYVRASPPTSLSAIDRYYLATQGILTAVNPAYFASYDAHIASLLYVGLISATENYFRDVLGFVLATCPIARVKSSAEKVQLGSLLWTNEETHGRAAFDFIAFSSSKNITETFSKFADIAVRKNGAWQSALTHYDTLCELRHAIVHSGLVVSGKNALKLGLSPSRDVLKISPTYATLQEAGAVCTALVQSANNEIFENLVARWAVAWRQLASWTPSEEAKLMASIYRAFFSTTDSTRGAIATVVTYRTLYRRIRLAHGLSGSAKKVSRKK